MSKNSVMAWHFLPENGRTRWNDIEVKPGLEIVHKGKIELCASGLHASINIGDALSYAPGPILCRVKCHGKIAKGDDKIVSTRRTVLWMFDASRVLRLWGCWCIRNLRVDGHKTAWELMTDIRSRNAVEVAERFAVGEVSRQELAAARDAAWAAAWDAARDAARDAAWAAAWDAARDAAWAAAWDAARAAAWDAAINQLEIMVTKEAKRLGVWMEEKAA